MVICGRYSEMPCARVMTGLAGNKDLLRWQLRLDPNASANIFAKHGQCTLSLEKQVNAVGPAHTSSRKRIEGRKGHVLRIYGQKN
mmetsp:Transcript_34845/g.80568  ORF Transcript_34845/g.80568 Transcript_34845/m.80568 type:complete len:85 (-) Transcript_34845:462-716(-)